MSRVSIGLSAPTPCMQKKTLRRFRNNEEADDVILIDVDSESFDNVIFIDVPESLPEKHRGSSRLRKDKWPSGNVINIDDDETPESHPFIGANNVNFSAGTSANREPSRVAKNFGDSATPVRLSKCKWTYSGKASRRNRYGFGTDSECDSSDNDCPDCELVEDSSGRVQEEWEKSFSRRRKDIHNDESKDETRQHKEATFGFTSGKSENGNDASSPCKTKNDTDFGCTHLSDDDAINDRQKKKDCIDCEPGCSGSHIEERKKNPASSDFEERKKNPASSDFASHKEPSKKFNHAIPIVEDEETSKVGHCPTESDLYVDEEGKSSPVEGEATVCKSKSSFEHEANQGRSFPGDNVNNVHETATGSVKERDNLGFKQSHTTKGAEETENLIPEKCSFEKSALADEQTDLSSTPSCDAVDVSEIPLSGSIHLNEAKSQMDNSTSNIQQQENKDSQNGDACLPEETSLISEREKLKETDEYKRATEEEWASRQQVLLIQAEEVRFLRRLQKRSKAESMRLLEMERRQKVRIEEMRNIQKKDEQNMNMKETIRVAVRNELKKLEIKCKNMASLLHLLGIRVGSWPHPSPQEVQTAYKRALLTFHPDRAPQSDIRQQVEAEEKFKLINRLKEKLPPS